MGTIEIGVQVGLLYAPLALGIYLALRVLSLPDLTLEGAFGIGGATTAALMADGLNPAVALVAGAAAGAAAGGITGCLHVYLHLSVLLAGILMTTAAWSIALMIMGTANVPLLTQTTVFDWAVDAGMGRQGALILVGGLVTAAMAVLLVAFLSTRYGLSLRATGMNIQTSRGQGVRTEGRQILGLMVANALAALSGGLVVQSQGFMDVSIQVGVIVVGIAALMIGAAIVSTPKLIASVIGVILGVIIYRIIVAFALELGVNPNYVRLVTAVVVVLMIAARANVRVLFSPPGTAGARRRRRENLEYRENDHVASFI